jgi:hypothetical protein
MSIRTDAEGCVDLPALRSLSQRLPQEDFVAEIEAPCLLFFVGPSNGGDGPAAGSTIEASIKRTVVAAENEAGNPSTMRYRDKVAVLRKRPGNPFPSMITLGRAMNNDVVLMLDTISKVHGYFMPEKPPSKWKYVDYNSRNGSIIQGKAVVGGTKNEVADGDRLRIGTDLSAFFMSPATLYQRLRVSS